MGYRDTFGRSQDYARCPKCREGYMVRTRKYAGVYVLCCNNCGATAREAVDDDGVSYGEMDYWIC